MVSPGFRSPGGRSFHSRGPAAEKLLSPSFVACRRKEPCIWRACTWGRHGEYEGIICATGSVAIISWTSCSFGCVWQPPINEHDDDDDDDDLSCAFYKYVAPPYCLLKTRTFCSDIGSLFRMLLGEDFVALMILYLLRIKTKKLFRQISNETHYLYPLIPKREKNDKSFNSPRNRGHKYLHPIESTLFLNI